MCTEIGKVEYKIFNLFQLCFNTQLYSECVFSRNCFKHSQHQSRTVLSSTSFLSFFLARARARSLSLSHTHTHKMSLAEAYAASPAPLILSDFFPAPLSSSFSPSPTTRYCNSSMSVLLMQPSLPPSLSLSLSLPLYFPFARHSICLHTISNCYRGLHKSAVRGLWLAVSYPTFVQQRTSRSQYIPAHFNIASAQEMLAK